MVIAFLTFLLLLSFFRFVGIQVSLNVFLSSILGSFLFAFSISFFGGKRIYIWLKKKDAIFTFFFLTLIILLILILLKVRLMNQ